MIYNMINNSVIIVSIGSKNIRAIGTKNIRDIIYMLGLIFQWLIV